MKWRDDCCNDVFDNTVRQFSNVIMTVALCKQIFGRLNTWYGFMKVLKLRRCHISVSYLLIAYYTIGHVRTISLFRRTVTEIHIQSSKLNFCRINRNIFICEFLNNFSIFQLYVIIHCTSSWSGFTRLYIWLSLRRRREIQNCLTLIDHSVNDVSSIQRISPDIK